MSRCRHRIRGLAPYSGSLSKTERHQHSLLDYFCREFYIPHQASRLIAYLLAQWTDQVLLGFNPQNPFFADDARNKVGLIFDKNLVDIGREI